MKKILFSWIFVLSCFVGTGQDMMSETESLLEELSITQPKLNDKVRIDVTGLSLYDFLNAIAVEHEINISADSDLDTVVQSSFFDIPILNVFSFAATKYDLDVKVINDIIVFKKKIAQPKEPEPVKEEALDISFNERNKFLSLKLSDDPLFKVSQGITDKTGYNFVLAPELKEEKVSLYVVNRPIDQVIEMLCKANDLDFKQEEDIFYLSKIKENVKEESSNKSSSGRRSRSTKVATKKDIPVNHTITSTANGYLDITASETPAYALLIEAAEALDVNYVVYNIPSELTATFKGQQLSFDEILETIFTDSEFTYIKNDDVYIIGLETSKGLRAQRLIQLENRTIEAVLETLPQELLNGVEVKEFLDLNGIMVSGSKPRIQELAAYIEQIDQVVPMILIEVIIAQYQKSNELQTGIKAGLSDEARGAATGVLFPDGDVQLGGSSINKLIDAFNGLGIFNLGKVTERFYLDLKFLENNSIINLQSTPKISTLNGHEATLSIGETSYYFEQSNELINSGLGGNVLQSGQWKPTEANLSLNIAPFVSKDEQITLTIGVEKSAFLGRQGENAPPGKATQQFESMVRCKNGEMILLGGLDELERENSGTGTPFLARVPVIKWLFSGRNKRKKKSKLHVFIKPTVVY